MRKRSLQPQQICGQPVSNGITPRLPHVSSHREMEMGALVAGLQQPMDPGSGNQADPVATLQQLNGLRSLQGVPLVGAADRMRFQNLQVPICIRLDPPVLNWFGCVPRSSQSS